MRKDITRGFGVLATKFGILERQFKGWYVEDLRILINCCIIMHNMMTEVRRDKFSFLDLLDEEDINVDGEDDATEEVGSIFPIDQVDVGQI